MLTAAVDTYKEHDVMTVDVPNAYIQIVIPHLEKSKERIVMKINGKLIDMLVQLAPEVYGILRFMRKVLKFYTYKY